MKMVSLELLNSAYNGDVTRLRNTPYIHEDITDEYLANCLHYAARSGSIATLNFLLHDCSFDIEKRTMFGSLALHEAAVCGELKAVKYLLDRCPGDEDITDHSGCTVLHLSSLYRHTHLLRWLLTHTECDVCKKSKAQALPLHCAVVGGSLDCVHSILNVEPKCVDAGMEGSVTATYLAAQHGHVDILKYLIHDCQADVTLRSSDGMTCLHAAAEASNLECVQILVDCGLYIDDEDLDGRNALDYAEMAKNREVLSWLMERYSEVVIARRVAIDSHPPRIAGGVRELVDYEHLYNATTETSDYSVNTSSTDGSYHISPGSSRHRPSSVKHRNPDTKRVVIAVIHQTTPTDKDHDTLSLTPITDVREYTALIPSDLEPSRVSSSSSLSINPASDHDYINAGINARVVDDYQSPKSPDAPVQSSTTSANIFLERAVHSEEGYTYAKEEGARTDEGYTYANKDSAYSYAQQEGGYSYANKDGGYTYAAHDPHDHRYSKQAAGYTVSNPEFFASGKSHQIRNSQAEKAKHSYQFAKPWPDTKVIKGTATQPKPQTEPSQISLVSATTSQLLNNRSNIQVSESKAPLRKIDLSAGIHRDKLTNVINTRVGESRVKNTRIATADEKPRAARGEFAESNRKPHQKTPQTNISSEQIHHKADTGKSEILYRCPQLISDKLSLASTGVVVSKLRDSNLHMSAQPQAFPPPPEMGDLPDVVTNGLPEPHIPTPPPSPPLPPPPDIVMNSDREKDGHSIENRKSMLITLREDRGNIDINERQLKSASLPSGSSLSPSSPNDLIAELRSVGASSLKRAPKSQGSTTLTYTPGAGLVPLGQGGSSATDYLESTPLVDKEKELAALDERFNSKLFIDKVPTTDSSGRPLPNWRKQMLARQMADRAKELYIAEKKKENYEARFKGMPSWKRAILEKRENKNAPSSHQQNAPP